MRLHPATFSASQEPTAAGPAPASAVIAVPAFEGRLNRLVRYGQVARFGGLQLLCPTVKQLVVLRLRCLALTGRHGDIAFSGGDEAVNLVKQQPHWASYGGIRISAPVRRFRRAAGSSRQARPPRWRALCRAISLFGPAAKRHPRWQSAFAWKRFSPYDSRLAGGGSQILILILIMELPEGLRLRLRLRD